MGSSIRHSATILVCLTVLSIDLLHAQLDSGLKLSHDSSWVAIGRNLTISVAQITSSRSEPSPPLFLTIYAQTGTAYDGGAPGRLLGRAPIGTLDANSQLNNLVVTTRYRGASPGLKYTALFLEQQDGKKFVTLDYVTYTSSYSFPAGQSGGAGSQDAAIGTGDVAIIGTNALTIRGRRADFGVERIQSQRFITMTGPLRLAVYATTAPYTGGTPDGVVLGSRVLGVLAPGDFYQGLQGRLTVKKPHRGTCYLTLAVEEQIADEFTPVAVVSYAEPQQF